MSVANTRVPFDAATASLQLHAAVRLRAPAVEGEQWHLQHLTSHTRYSVGAHVAWLVVSFVKGADVAAVLDEVERRGGSREEALHAVRALREAEILVDSAEVLQEELRRIRTDAGTDSGDLPGPTRTDALSKHLWAKDLAREWAHAGWSGAADYHIATFDYPAVSYEEGIGADAALMEGYVSVEPDLDRTKKVQDPLASLPTPAAVDALALLTRPFDEVWQECCGLPRAITAPWVAGDHVRTLCGAVCGRLRSRRVGTPDQDRAPLVRKISPSGGSRHPTECYVVAIDVWDLPRGVYHYSSQTDSLDLLGEAPDDQHLELLFDGLYRSRHERTFEPRALFIFTSVFDRNMYRYREPRTFRTVFMDVGCIITNLELIARSLGYSMYTHNAMADVAIEELLGIDGLTEGLMYGAAIGVYQR